MVAHEEFLCAMTPQASRRTVWAEQNSSNYGVGYFPVFTSNAFWTASPPLKVGNEEATKVE